MEDEVVWLLSKGDHVATFRSLPSGEVVYTIAACGKVEWSGTVSKELARCTWDNLRGMGYTPIPSDT